MGQPVVPGQPQVLLSQLGDSPALGVLAGGEQLLFAALKDLADALQ